LLGHDFNDKINDLFLSLLRKNLDEAGLKNAEIIKIEGKTSAFVVTGVEEKRLQEILQKTENEFIEQLNKIGLTINKVKTFTGKNLDEISDKLYYAKIPDLFKNDTNMKMIVDYFNNQKEFANSFVLLSKTQKKMLKDLISKVPINEFKHNQKEMEIAINTLKNAIDKFSIRKDARNINDFFQIWEDEIMKIADKENYKNIATNFSVFSVYILSHVNVGLKKQQTEKNIEKEKINK
jgi:arsenate reductase-like glutaredoxin family protein